MFDLLNIFKTFLPQLLLYPNAADPLNGEAASLMLKDKKCYAKKVRSMVEKYAKDDIVMEEETPEDNVSDLDMDAEEFEDMSDIDEHYLDHL